jgi:histidinol-phosphatase (PHP family)
MRIDLHNHTTLCNHASGTMEEYIQRAIELGIDIFGFSEHNPMNFDQKYRMKFDEFDSYLKNIDDLQSKYKDKITILKALEFDYIDDFEDNPLLNDDRLDYLIGSCHFIDKWGFDNPEFIGNYKNKDIDKIWSEYFEIVEQIAKCGKFDIIGHIDLIKVFNFLPKKDIKDIVKNSIEAIKNANMVVEVNSAGFRKPSKEQYPSKDILKMIYENGIDITITSDAHSVSQVGLNYEKSLEIVKNIGFTQLAYFKNREKILVDI